MKIAIVNAPSESEYANALISRLVKLLSSFSEKLFVFSSSFKGYHETNIIPIRIKIPKELPISSQLSYILAQLKILRELKKIKDDVDIVMLFLGSRGYLLPAIFSKLWRKKVIIIHTGNSFEQAKVRFSSYPSFFQKFRLLLPRILEEIENINYSLVADAVVVETHWAIKKYGRFSKIRNKTRWGTLYVDTRMFHPTVHVNKRGVIVGFVGRLTPEKGVIELARAIKIIMQKFKLIKKVIFVGDGNSKLEILNILSNERDNIFIAGMVSAEMVPTYLNQMKLMVFPSYTEGFANAVAESMACGTPTLTTRVGLVNDFAMDEKNALILKTPTPSEIASKIQYALNNPKILVKISHISPKLILKYYSFEASKERFFNILGELYGGDNHEDSGRV